MLRTADSPMPATTADLTADILCERYAGRVFKFAQFLSQDAADADDLAQETLERAIKGLKTFDPTKGNVERWLWRIAVNAGRDLGRIARRQRLVFELLVERWTNDEQAGDPSEPRSHDLLTALRGLSQRHRTVLALRYGGDLPYRDVAHALGISEAAALMATRRALAILRVRLSGVSD